MLATPILLMILTAAALRSWNVPTRVLLNFTVSRISFTVAGTTWYRRIVNSTPFISVTFENFSLVRFRPTRLHVADPSRYELTTDRYPESAWQPVRMNIAVRVHFVLTVEHSIRESHSIGGCSDGEWDSRTPDSFARFECDVRGRASRVGSDDQS